MSRITNFDTDDIMIKQFQVDYMTINSYSEVNEMDNERLLVNQFENDRFSIIGGKHGLAINATRQQARDMTGIGLFVDDNVYLTGTLYTSNIHMLGNTLNDTNTEKILTTLNSYVQPIQSAGMIENNLFNYYLPDFLTIGTYNDAIKNRHSLNISRRANNSINNIQLAIRNQTDNVLTNDVSELLIGTVGDSAYAPAIIMTSVGKSLEFFVGHSRDDVDILYNNKVDYFSNVPNYNNGPIPTLSIDTSGCLNINSSNSLFLDYKIDPYVSACNVTRLNVNGLGYIEDIVTYDHATQEKRHLNDIFLRQHGLTLKADQIKPGMFADGSYSFSSNVDVSYLEVNNELLVHSNMLVDGLMTLSNELNVYHQSYFNDTAVFKDSLCYNLDVNGSLKINGDTVQIMQVTQNKIKQDVPSILTSIPSTVDSSNMLATMISNYMLFNGTSNLYNFVHDTGLTDEKETNQIVLSILTNYTTEAGNIFSYFLKDNLNYSNSNLLIPGTLGVGIQNNETFNSVLTINRHRDLNQFTPEITINDIPRSTNKYIHQVFMGHARGQSVSTDYNAFSIATSPNKLGNHNIAFYPGIIPTLTNGLVNEVPSLLLTNYPYKVGFNTKQPRNEIDMNMNILFGKDCYKLYNNVQCKIVNLLLNQNNEIIIDNPNLSGINLNVQHIGLKNGSINARKFFEYSANGNLVEIKNIKTMFDGAYFNAGNINFGYQADILPLNNVAMQIRNTNVEGNNNSVIRLLESYDSWNNVDKYTGIELCRYVEDVQQRWYIYNRHDGINNLVIGYQNASDDRYDIMKLIKNVEYNEIHLNTDDGMDSTYIHGSLTVYGDINVMGSNSTYRLNGLELTSNGIKISTIETPTFSNNNLNIQEKYDILVQANKVVNLVNEISTFYIGHMIEQDNQLINYFALYLNEQNTLTQQLQTNVDSRFVVFHRQSLNDVNHQPVAAFKVHPEVAGMSADCRVRLGVLPNSTSQNYYKEHTFADLQLLSSMNNSERVGEFRLNLFTNTFANNTAIRIYNNNNQVYYKFASDTVPHIASSLFHVFNNYHMDTLHLQNNNHMGVSLLMQNNNHMWRLNGKDALNISKEGSNIFTIKDQSIGINNTSPDYAVDISTVNGSNIGGFRVKNLYSNLSDVLYSSNINLRLDVMDYIPDLTFSSNEGLRFNIDYTHFNYNKVQPANFLINSDSNIRINDQIKYDFSNVYADIPFTKDIIDYNIMYDIQIITNTPTLNVFHYTSIIEFTPAQSSYNMNDVYDNIFYNIEFNKNIIDTYTTHTLDVVNGFQIVYMFKTISPKNIEIFCRSPNNTSVEIFLYMRGNTSITLDDMYVSNNIQKFMMMDSKYTSLPFLNTIYNINTKYFLFNDNPLMVDVVFDGIYSIDVIGDVKLLSGLKGNDNILTRVQDDHYRLVYLSDFGDTSNVEYVPFNFRLEKSFVFNNTLLSIERDLLVDYEKYARTSNTGIFNASFNTSKPHLVLESEFNTTNTKHNMYSYDGNLEIYAQDNDSFVTKVFSLDRIGNLIVNSIDVNEVKIGGNTLADYNDLLYQFQNLKIDTISSSNYVYIEAAKTVLVNTDILRFDLDDTVIIDRNRPGSNVLTLTNYYDYGTFMYFTDRIENYYKLGIESDHFRLYYKDFDIPALDIQYDDLTQMFKYKFYGKMDYDTMNNGELDVGDVHITTNSIYNANALNDDVISFKKDSKTIMNIAVPRITMNTKLLANNGIDVIGGINQLSDRRLKQDIVPIDNALERLTRLCGVIYKNTMTQRVETGLIAQDVNEVLPEVVGKDTDNNMTISYGNMMGLVVEAIKSLKEDIDSIKLRLYS